MVGIILRNIREIKRMKQKQVAYYLRVEENTISNYEIRKYEKQSSQFYNFSVIPQLYWGLFFCVQENLYLIFTILDIKETCRILCVK